MDHTTAPNVVVDVAPAPAHDLTEKSDRRSVPDIPGSQTETPKRRLLHNVLRSSNVIEVGQIFFCHQLNFANDCNGLSYDG